MSRKVRRYTKEFKEEAVVLALKSPSIASTATELGVPVATMHAWISQLKGKPIAKEGDSNPPDVATLIEENRRLHKELSVAKEEKEILKKAAAYFAQHQK
jgi:transposase